jgi:hypothetical protein
MNKASYYCIGDVLKREDTTPLDIPPILSIPKENKKIWECLIYFKQRAEGLLNFETSSLEYFLKTRNLRMKRKEILDDIQEVIESIPWGQERRCLIMEYPRPDNKTIKKTVQVLEDLFGGRRYRTVTNFMINTEKPGAIEYYWGRTSRLEIPTLNRADAEDLKSVLGVFYAHKDKKTSLFVIWLLLEELRKELFLSSFEREAGADPEWCFSYIFFKF